MYADKITGSMERAIGETNRRRKIQMDYNAEHGIVPKTIIKGVRDVIDLGRIKDDQASSKGKKREKNKKLTSAEREKMIADLTREMKEASKRLEFEQAAFLRDRINELKAGK